MKRGPKSQAAALKLLKGNPNKRPIVDDASPQPDALDAAIPEELDGSHVARMEWNRAIRPAIAIGQITAADRTLAIAHCELFAIWRSQSAQAATAAHVIKMKNGYPAPNPVRVMASRTLAQLTKIDGELGFTPTSRSRVTVKGPGTVRAAVDKERAKFFKTSGRG